MRLIKLGELGDCNKVKMMFTYHRKDLMEKKLKNIEASNKQEGGITEQVSVTKSVWNGAR